MGAPGEAAGVADGAGEGGVDGMVGVAVSGTAVGEAVGEAVGKAVGTARGVAVGGTTARRQVAGDGGGASTQTLAPVRSDERSAGSVRSMATSASAPPLARGPIVRKTAV